MQIQSSCKDNRLITIYIFGNHSPAAALSCIGAPPLHSGSALDGDQCSGVAVELWSRWFSEWSSNVVVFLASFSARIICVSPSSIINAQFWLSCAQVGLVYLREVLVLNIIPPPCKGFNLIELCDVGLFAHMNDI